MNKQKLGIVGAIAGIGVLSGILMYSLSKNDKHINSLNDYYDHIDKHGICRCIHAANKILNKFDDYE